MLTLLERLVHRTQRLERAQVALVANLNDTRNSEANRRALVNHAIASAATEIAALKIDLMHVQAFAGPVPDYLPPVVERPLAEVAP